MTVTAATIVDLVRDPVVSRQDAIALVEQYGRQHAHDAADMASNLVWDQVLALLDHRANCSAALQEN